MGTLVVILESYVDDPSSNATMFQESGYPVIAFFDVRCESHTAVKWFAKRMGLYVSLIYIYILYFISMDLSFSIIFLCVSKYPLKTEWLMYLEPNIVFHRSLVK